MEIVARVLGRQFRRNSGPGGHVDTASESAEKLDGNEALAWSCNAGVKHQLER